MVSTIGIVSLSSGIIGEDFVKHEVDLGIQRLKDLGLNPIFLPHSLKGLDFIKEHPEARAEDLIHAFSDDSIDMILCAIGGDDTYRLLPYLFENDQLQKVIKPKIFLGFSAICATIGVFISPRACRILLQTPSVNSPILTTQTILPYTTTSRMISSEFVEILA